MNNSKIKAPGVIYATQGDDPGVINLQWDSVEGACGYIIQRSSPQSSGSWQHVDIVNESKYTIGGLSVNRRFFFRVAAIDKTGQSSWSKEISKKVN